MCNEHIVRLFAGIVVLVGIVLAHYVADYWIFLSIFMGVILCSPHSQAFVRSSSS